MSKQLHVATDFFDEVVYGGGFPGEDRIGELAAYIASLGAVNAEWVDESFMGFYNEYPGGFDLFESYAKAAHRHGLTVSAVIKPFELTEDLVPHTFPAPAAPVFLDSIRGRFVVGNDLAFRRPELGLRVRPGDWNPPGPVTAIRLVRDSDRPSGLAAADLSVWVGERNGEWAEWTGPFRLTQSLEWRNLYPTPKHCRVLTLDGLAIPERFRYVEVRCARPDPEGDYSNDVTAIVELAGPGGKPLPITTPAYPSYSKRAVDWLLNPALRELTLYGRQPEVARFLADPERARRMADEMRVYSRKASPVVPYAFDTAGRVAVARGRDTHLGILHPIYPEVRAFWLERVRYFLDRGADAVNFRHNSHFSDAHSHDYGFNEPVLERTGGSLNRAEVARVNGAAYTQLLREASALTRARGKRFGVHVASDFLRRSDEGKLGITIENFDFEWETWIRELADFVEFRGAMGNQKERLQAMIDRFGLACREAGIPLIYQSNRRYFSYDGPYPYHDDEMAWVLAHPDVAAYQLYETAAFLRWKDGRFTGSPAIRALAAKHGFAVPRSKDATDTRPCP